MNNSTYRFTLDLQKHNSQMSVPVYKHDNAVRLLISMTDGGKPYIIGEGSYAIFYGMRADGKALIHKCEFKDVTEIIYDFKNSTACCEGIVSCQIRLYSADKKLISAPKFTIVVEDRVVNIDEVEIEDDDRLEGLDQIFTEEKARIEAEEGRVEGEWARVVAEDARTSAWVRYSAYSDGTNYTETWSEGQNYIGVAMSHDCPTDKSGYVWSLFKGEKGDKGKQGDKGEKGETGDPFRIAKVYSSVASMNADFSNTAIPEGSFVAIETGNVDHPDNAKLYLKGETEFTFITDLSGAQGLRGEKGEKGDPGDIGRITPEAEELILWAFATNGTHGLAYDILSDSAWFSGINTDICKETDIEIGSIVKGLPVTNIGRNAFLYCKHVTSVKIPDSVKIIEDYAFDGCTMLRKVVIPSGVKKISYAVFQNCTGLQSVIIPDSVTDIAANAFRNCNSIQLVGYRGTEAQWNAIKISSTGNESLTSANIYYNYEYN